MLYNYVFENENGEKLSFSPYGEIIALKVDGVNGHNLDISTSENVGQIGTTINNTKVKAKTITIDGVLKRNVNINRKKIIDTIKPQIKGVLYAINIQTLEVYKMEVIAKQTPIVGFGFNYQEFQLEFYCAYPYWKIEQQKAVDIRKLIPLFSFPRSFEGSWKISMYERSEFINVVNDGNEKTGIKIVLIASTTAKNPKLLNVKTGEYIKLNYEMEAGEVITITTTYNNKRVVSDKKGNIFKYLDLLNSTFLQLDVGDNIFKFEAETNKDNIQVTIYYDEAVSSI